MMSSTLGAPLGGTMRGGHQGLESSALSLITPPNFGGGGGSWLPLIVVVALGSPSTPVTVCAVTGAVAMMATSSNAATSLVTPDFSASRFIVSAPSPNSIWTCLMQRHRADPTPLPLVFCPGDRFCRFFLIRGKQLRRTELDGQFVDLAVECERHLVVLFVHRRAGVDADVEGLVSHLQERDRICLFSGGDDLAVHRQHAGAALRDAGAVIGVVEHYRMLAGRERVLAYPLVLGEDEHVVVEHGLALEHVQSPSTPTSTHCREHPVATALWHVDVGVNRV